MGRFQTKIYRGVMESKNMNMDEKHIDQSFAKKVINKF